jgi:uncharacterized protein YkwD
MTDLHNPHRSVRGAGQRRPKRRVVVTGILLLLGGGGVAAPSLLPQAAAAPTHVAAGSLHDEAFLSTTSPSEDPTQTDTTAGPAGETAPRLRQPAPAPEPAPDAPEAGDSSAQDSAAQDSPAQNGTLPGLDPWRREPAPRHTRPPSPEARPAADVAMEKRVVQLVNQHRAAAGCRGVRLDDRLTSASFKHSKDMATNDFFDHTGSDGSSPWDRAKKAGYNYAHSENLAARYETPEEVVRGWMNSPKHKKNLLNCTSKAIGVAVRRGGSKEIYWTQMFGSK